jgi:hypothetical protein
MHHAGEAAVLEREQHIHQLLALEEMDDHRSYQFLSHLRSFAQDVPYDFLHSIWASRLPPNVQAILAG